MIGAATLRRDRSLLLQLRAEGDDFLGDAIIIVGPDEDSYASWLGHIGELAPGQIKLVPDWPEKVK